MEPNYTIIALVALVLFIIILFFLYKNKRDRKKLEKELNERDLHSKKHQEEEIE